MSVKTRSALIIIAKQNGGKSTVIRATTGVSRAGQQSGKYMQLKDRRNNPITALVYVASPQESGVDPNDFLNTPPYSEIAKGDYDILILPLEHNHQWNPQDYIEQVKNYANKIYVVFLEAPSQHLIGYLKTNNIVYDVINYTQNEEYEDPFYVAYRIRMGYWPPDQTTIKTMRLICLFSYF